LLVAEQQERLRYQATCKARTCTGKKIGHRTRVKFRADAANCGMSAGRALCCCSWHGSVYTVKRSSKVSDIWLPASGSRSGIARSS
jgi:hypothetical protein